MVNFKKFLSLFIAISIATAFVVTPVSAETEVVYELASYYTEAAHKQKQVKLDEFMETGEIYEFSFNVKPDSMDVYNPIRIDLGFRGNVASPGNYGMFYLYDNGTNALGASQWGNIGGVSAYKDAVATDGIDMNIIWDTVSGVANITAGFPGKDYKYAFTMGKVSAGGSYGELIIWSESTAVTITDLVIAKQVEDEQEKPENVIYTEENGWATAAGTEEMPDGSLKIAKGSANATKFTPNLEPGKLYEITYDVSGLEVVSGSWRKPFTVSLYADGQTESDILTYRQAGAWRNAKTDALVVEGSNGRNKIIINTETGEWEAYALGTLASKSGMTINANGQTKTYNKLENTDDIAIGFYSMDSSDDFDAPYISNVRVVEKDYIRGKDEGLSVNNWYYDEYSEKLNITFNVDEESGTDVYVTLVDGDDNEVSYAEATLSEFDNVIVLDAVGFDAEGGYKVYVRNSSGDDITDPVDLSEKLNLCSFPGKVDVHNDVVNEYLNDGYDTALNYATGKKSYDKPNPVVLSWSYEKSDVSEFIIKVSENEDLTDAWEYTSDVLFCDVYNAKVGTQYYWNVTAEYKDGTSYTSETGTFVTENQAPRQIYAKGVSNMRDVGGWTTKDNHVVKQGLVYRSACFEYEDDEDNTKTIYYIQDEGKDVLVNQLGIKSEIDLRYERVTNKTESVLGSGVKLFSYPMNYSGDMMSENKATIKSVFEVLGNADNYPVVYHCQAGADRTGVITYLLNGLLGVEKEDLLRDYLLTNFSTAAGGQRDLSGITGKYVKTLDEYQGATLSDKIYNYLSKEVGVSAGTLDFIISYMGSQRAPEDEDEPQEPEGGIYTEENGWGLGTGAEEMADGRLKISKGPSNATTFKPNLKKGKTYEITYEVSGLQVVSGSWRKPFTASLYSGGQTESDILTYRQAGQWRNAKTDALVVSGSNGYNKIIINTKTGEWEAYALDVLASKSDMTVDANGQTKTYNKLQSTDDITIGFYSYDTASDFEAPYIKNVTVKEVVPEAKPDFHYVKSYKTAGAGNIYRTELDNIFKTGYTYELSWNIKPDSIDGHSIRADILGGDIPSQGNYGFFLLFQDNGGSGLFMSDYNKLGNVADQVAEVAEKGVDMNMLWDTQKGIVDITVTFPTGKSYKCQWNPGVLGEGKKYGALALQGPHTPVTISDLTIKRVDLVSDATPQLEDSDIKFYAGDTEQKKENVSAFTDRITVDFGQYMNVEDMTSDKIYVIDNSTKEVVTECVESYSEGIYTLTFEKGLTPEKSYILKAEPVRTATGKSGDAYSKTFYVEGGKAAEILSVVKDGDEVTDLSEFSTGTMQICMNYVNTEDEDTEIHVVAGYYNDKNELVKADYIKNAFDEEGGIRQIAEYKTVMPAETYNYVQITVVDSFEKMIPVSAPFGIKVDGTEKFSYVNDGAENGDISVNVVKDITAGTVTVDVNTCANDVVSLYVLPKTITPGMIEEAPEKGADSEYVKTVIADENGNVNHSFVADPGDYNLYVASAKLDRSVVNSLVFVDAQNYETLISILKGQNKDDFLETVKSDNNKALLGFDIDIYSDKAVKRLYDEYKSALSETDYEQNLKNFKKCALIEALNSNADVDAAGYIKDVYADDSDLMKYMNKYVISEETRSYFTNRMKSVSNRSVEDSDDLLETAKEAIILSVVKYPSEANNIKTVMKDYKNILGIKNVSDYASVYRSLENNEYKTIKEFLSDYEEAVEKASDSKSSGGGGGGGGGGGRVTPSTASGGVVSAPDTAGQTQNINIFDDIDNVDWAKESIEALYKRGMVNGKENKKFYPEDKVLREEFVKMLVATFDMKLVGGELPFADVSYDAWYYDYVRTAYLAEAVNGVSETEFGIGKNITRQDICTMTYRMLLECDVEVPAVKEKMNFGDEDSISDYAKEAVFALQTAGVINGDTYGNFNPQATATRAETAKIMYGVLNMIERR